MRLLDDTYFNFNKRENYYLETKDLSDIVVLAKSSVVNLQIVKKYKNQYSIDVAKKELYLIEDNIFQSLLKASNILNSKDYQEWDWKKIDEILDVIEYRKELSIIFFFKI